MVTCPASFTLAGRFPTTIIVIVKRERDRSHLWLRLHAPVDAQLAFKKHEGPLAFGESEH